MQDECLHLQGNLNRNKKATTELPLIRNFFVNLNLTVLRSS